MKKLFMSVALLLLVVTSFAQTPGYEFTTIVCLTKQRLLKIRVPQEPAGALPPLLSWSRNCSEWGKGEYDLSEMFIVRQKYMNQMEDNYLRRGKGSIGEGSLAHTFKKTLIRKRESFRKKCTPDC